MHHYRTAVNNRLVKMQLLQLLVYTAIAESIAVLVWLKSYHGTAPLDEMILLSVVSTMMSFMLACAVGGTIDNYISIDSMVNHMVDWHVNVLWS